MSSEAEPTGTDKRLAGRFVFIDALRGLAALSVVLFHTNSGRHIAEFFATLPVVMQAVIEYGDLGVQVFFVLSGFVIAHSMARQNVGASYVGRFMLRRSIRLDPPYWASMLLVIALGVLSTHVVAGRTYEVPSFSDIIIHVLYLPELLRRPLINYVYWTLCLEIQFYFVFSLLMWVVTALRPRLGARTAFYALMLPATVFADLWAFGVQPFNVVGLFTEHWHFFMAGVLVWNAVANPDDRAATPLAAINLVALGAAGPFTHGYALEVGAVTCGAILVVGKLGKLRTFLGSRPFQFLGAISYSLYLVHNPIAGAAFRAGYMLTGRSLWLEAFWFVMVVAICIVFAWAFYRVIELPSMRFSRKVPLKKGTAAHQTTAPAPRA